MQIPGYKILDTLGKGGMATVYLAIQESFDRKVAIKVMSPQLAEDPSFGERFQREAKIVSQMNHPNIVTVYDVGVVNKHHYLAMEYVPGKELRDRFKKMNLVERVRAIKEVAAALNYAGNKGYVHRDVKPENVMICEEDGRAVLMDFGIAKTTDTDHSMTKTGMAIGTPYYMSPEQAQGKPVDKRSDIYSLGVMLFQMLTGRVPYDAESQVAIGIKHITEPVPLLPTHLRVFQPIINKVMAKNPNHRYQTGAELASDLDKINVTELNKIDRVEHQAFVAASKTDPNASTVLTDATSSNPPILNTGNVTTADAARLATRISSAAQRPSQNENKNSPLAAIIVIALLLVGGLWFLTQQNTEKSEPRAEAQVPQVPTTENIAAATATAAVETTNEVTINTNTAVDTTAEVHVEPMQDDSAKIAEQKKQEELAQAEEQKRQQALAQAEEQKRQEEIKKAEAQKKQEEAARIAKEKQLAELLAQKKQQQEAAKAQQLRLREIETRLNKAKVLREQGHLVSPAGENAVTAYRAVVGFDPANTEAKHALDDIENSYLIGIRYLIEQGELDEAASKLVEADSVFPDSQALADLHSMQQKKAAEIAAAKAAAIAEAAKPKITKLVVNDAAFESMQLAQKNSLAMGRTAYVGFSYQNFAGATSVLQASLYDSSHTLKIIQKSVVATGAQGDVFFTLPRPVEGFPDGGYNLELMLNDQKLAAVLFTVSH